MIDVETQIIVAISTSIELALDGNRDSLRPSLGQYTL
jgi:hypothetical protein